MLFTKKYQTIKNTAYPAAFIFVIAGILIGCNDETPVNSLTTDSRIAGRVVSVENIGKLDKSLHSISGASVKLMKIGDSGLLEQVTAGKVSTDDDGKFILETSFSGNSELVLIAERDGQIWKAVLTGKLKSGITVYCQPLTEESTVEAELYIEAKRMGYTNIQYADISVLLNAELALMIVKDENVRRLLLQAFEQSANVFSQVVVKGEFGGDVNRWQSAVKQDEECRSTLERDLYFADEPTKSEAAIKKYLDARVYAYINAGLSAGVFFNALSISVKVFLNASNNISEDLSFLIKKRAALLKAVILRHAVQEEFSHFGSPQEIIRSGDILLNKLNSANSKDEINSIYGDYKTTVINQLKIVSGLNSTLVTITAGSIEELSNTFWTSLPLTVSVPEIIDAYIKYYMQAKTSMDNIEFIAGEMKSESILSILFYSCSNYKI